MVATAASVLTELRALSHNGRVARMVALGRAAATDKKTRALLDELARGEVFERRLVLKSCFTSRDGARVLAAVADPSRLVRGAARKLVALVCDDAQTLTALQQTYAVRQHLPVLLTLRRRGRLPPIDAFLTWLAERPDQARLAELLPLGSPALLDRLLPAALLRPSTLFWQRLAALAPERLCRLLAEKLQEGSADAQWRWVLERWLPQLAAAVPVATCSVVERLLAQGLTVEPQVIDRLIAGSPGAVLALGLRHRYRFAAGAFLKAAHRLSSDELAQLIVTERRALGEPRQLWRTLSAADKPLLLRAWLQDLQAEPSWGLSLLTELGAPETPAELSQQRDAAYAAWSYAARDSEGVIAPELVDRLPPDLQAREAERHLSEVAQLQTRPLARIAYSLYLPWEQARAVLQPYLGHPDAETRGQALGILLQIPGRWPSRPELLTEALRLARARKHEQDPVRLKLFQALDTWPRALWQKQHLTEFGALLRDALDAADLSSVTAQAMERVLVKLFRLDGEAGSRWLTTLIKERGTLYAPRLGEQLSDADVKVLGEPLLQVAQAWAVRERQGYLVALLTSLGKRMALVPGLVKLTETVIEDTVNPSTSSALLTLLYEHAQERALAIVGPTVKRWRKRGWESQLPPLLATLTQLPPSVEEVIEEVLLRTDSLGLAASLLTALRYRHTGLFVRLVPRLLKADRSYFCIEPLWRYVHRHRQELLTPLLGEEVVSGRFASGKTRWVLPFSDGFFRWSSEQQRTFSATLQRLILDPQRDTPTVLWALSRLPRLAFAAAEPLCRLTDDGRAAVAEKAIRSLARLDAGQGVPQLIVCLEDARARFAVYALRGALFDMPPARAVELLGAVPLRKVTVAKEVLRLLGELRSDAAYALLIGLDKPTLHRDVRVALLRALWDHLEREETWTVLHRAAADPDGLLASRLADIPAERLSPRSEPRLVALLAQILARPEPEVRLELLRRAPTLPLKDRSRELLAACLRRLDSPFTDEITAATAALLRRAELADVAAFEQALAALRPNRRALQLVTEALRSTPSPRRQVVSDLLSAALRVLALEAPTATLLVTLAASAGVTVLAATLRELAARELLHAEVLAAAKAGALALPVDDAETLELQLRDRPEPGLRLLAVTALSVAAGPSQGWTPARRARLRAYQQDPAPPVSGSAQFIFPPAELPAATAPAKPGPVG